jgi:hypothetical protein
MIKWLSRIFLLLWVTALFAGCKLAVIVVEGGEVSPSFLDSSSTLETCAEGAICIIDVPSTDFSEVFQAIPKPGWYFDSWHSGSMFFCGDSSGPFFASDVVCKVSLLEHRGNRVIEEVVASSETFYVMPIFKKLQPDLIEVDGRSVIVEGRKWLQPVDFKDYSYSQVSEVCPGGSCVGSLPGSTIELTGYTWASSDDVRLLYRVYRKIGKAVSRDFEYTGQDLKTLFLTAILSDSPYVEQSSTDNTRRYYTAVVASGEGVVESSQELRFFASNSYDIGAVWFWRPVD